MKNISGSITAGLTAQTLSAASESRAFLFFQNISDTDMYLSEIGTATADTPSIKVAAGATLTLTGVPQCRGAWSLYCATTGKKFTAREA